jgi:predicted DNA-binding transcriptional regulator AlpA
MDLQVATTPHGGGAFNTPEIFLTETQLADLLKVSRRSVQRWRVEGRGPRFRKHGSSVRYALSDALAWSEANAAHSTSEQAA